MQLKHTSAIASIITGGVLAFSATTAGAFNFASNSSLGSCADLLTGVPTPTPAPSSALYPTTLNSCSTADGFTLTPEPTGKSLQAKIVGGINGVGVSGEPPTDPTDAVPGEIDVEEVLRVDLASAGVLKSLDLSFLYKTGEFVDQVFEVAIAQPFGSVDGILQVINETTAKWTWDGVEQTVIATSPSTQPNGGWYSISNPFGDTTISGFRLKTHTQPDVFPQSDFALVGAELAEKKEIPEPATLVGIGAIASSLLFLRRRSPARA